MNHDNEPEHNREGFRMIAGLLCVCWRHKPELKLVVNNGPTDYKSWGIEEV